MIGRRARAVGGGAVAGGAVALVLVAGAAAAHADEFEAAVGARPVVGVAAVSEVGAAAAARVRLVGLAVEAGYGVRDWLDVGGELLVAALGEARYDTATVTVDGYPMAGPLQRVSRAGQLRGVTRARWGVVWVPTVEAAVGLGARVRTSALLRGTSARGEATYVPDGQAAGAVIDAVVALRVGLEHRLDRRWSVALSVGAARWLGVTTPDVVHADVALALARRWYPRW
jgi:hypothetical protein